MSDTPRTDAEANEQYSMVLTGNGLRRALVQSDFARQLERELTEANARIKRLEEAGDKLSDCADQIGWTSCESPQWIKKAENAVKEWLKAKESKP